MNEFQRITATPAALATLLESLPTLGGPWDDAFHRVYCDTCQAEDCDAPGGCPHQEIRGNVIPWWLEREVKQGERGL